MICKFHSIHGHALLFRVQMISFIIMVK